MCGLGHILEAAGLSTVALALIPQHARAMRPPRALAVPFELGRPFGAPDDAVLQRRVLDAALTLLDAPGPGPHLRTLDVPIPRAADDTALDGWACPIPLADGAHPDASRVADEVARLQPWYDRARDRRGHTSFGASGLEIAEVVGWLEGLCSPTPPTTSPVDGLSVGDLTKLAAEDLKAFYIEAATARPGDPPPRAIDDWFWEESAAGALLRALRTRLSDSEDGGLAIHARLTLVPQARVSPRAPR